MGALTVGIGITPFEDEGRRENLRAQEGLAKLRRATDVTFEISHQRQAEIDTPASRLLNAFNRGEKPITGDGQEFFEACSDICMQAEKPVAARLASTFASNARQRPADIAL